MALFMKAAGIQLRHLPTTGGGPALTALLGNNSQVLVSSVAAASGADQGRQGARARLFRRQAFDAALPDVPTMKELGYDVEFYLWVGLFAPKGTPEPIITTLRDATQQGGRRRPVQAGDEQSRPGGRLSGPGRVPRPSGTTTPSASRTRCASSARSRGDRPARRPIRPAHHSRNHNAWRDRNSHL